MEWARSKRDRLGLRAWIEATWLRLGGPGCLADQGQCRDAEVFLQLLDRASIEVLPLRQPPEITQPKEHPMLKTLILSALLVGALSGAALASDTVSLTDESKARIRQTLTEQGYEVGKIKIEDGLYEAYARKDGAKFEIFLDANFAVVRTERDD